MTDIIVRQLITTITGVKNLSKNIHLFFVWFNMDKECFHGHFHSLDGTSDILVTITKTN